MDRDLFLPHSWEALRWWIVTAKRLINDISGGRPCNAKCLVAEVENHLEGKPSKPFELIPQLLVWITCDFRHHVETALTTFANVRRSKSSRKWLKAKKRA
jgi:hypothetical protein